MIIDLNKPDLRNMPVGIQVKTSKGFTWRLENRVDGLESWLDEETGMTWSDTDAKAINHHQALRRFGNKLPTNEEFEIAEEHGIREVVDLSCRRFWSSTVHPNFADYAYVFGGDYGAIGVNYRVFSVVSSAALCVSR